MGQPESVRLVLTVLFAAITLTCVARLVAYRSPVAGLPARHDDLAHIVKGVGMIAMMLSWTHLVPVPFWVLLFAGVGVYFAALLVRPAGAGESWDHVDHLMGSAGMIYMLVAVGGGAMSMSMSPLAVSFGVYFLAYGLWSGVRALRPAVAGAGAGDPMPKSCSDWE